MKAVGLDLKASARRAEFYVGVRGCAVCVRALSHRVIKHCGSGLGRLSKCTEISSVSPAHETL